MIYFQCMGIGMSGHDRRVIFYYSFNLRHDKNHNIHNIITFYKNNLSILFVFSENRREKSSKKSSSAVNAGSVQHTPPPPQQYNTSHHQRTDLSPRSRKQQIGPNNVFYNLITYNYGDS